ncbi:hypothetical protein ACJIZ3_008816 [Penstemon smallii]|uniref:GH10 domain-containing protein n=1 Tax=Penstemon smallii TaxID=265156 RepID=A0ABD3TAU9_9LAMI
MYSQKYCLATPIEAQYGGGIVVNSDLNQGLNGWTQIGNEKLELGQSKDGNNFIVVSKFGNTTWVQVSQGNAYVEAVFKTNTNTIVTAGWVAAKEGCWSMLKGGVVVTSTGPAQLYFKADNSSTSDIWVDNISLQPFTKEEWKSHQDQSIEKVRKGKVKFQAVDEHGRPISNATVSIKQTRPDFPFGCAMSSFILENTSYKNWFTTRFKYYTVKEGFENYDFPDRMLDFCKTLGLSVRGHTIHWGNRACQPNWLLNETESKRFQDHVNARTNSVVKRYAGQLIHWDVVNENLHNDFFETILGENASTVQFQKVLKIDPKPVLFLNEYFTIEKSEDKLASPWKYLQKIWKTREQGYNGPLGIGLQGHFSCQMNLPYIRSSLDVLESAKLPIWVTELDVSNSSGWSLQPIYLEHIMRELHSHRAVQGMMIWSAWWPNGKCYKMCLTDDNFNNLPTGDVIDKIMAEWIHEGLQGSTNGDGYFETLLFHGEYEANINNVTTHKFKVSEKQDSTPVLLFTRST